MKVTPELLQETPLNTIANMSRILISQTEDEWIQRKGKKGRGENRPVKHV